MDLLTANNTIIYISSVRLIFGIELVMGEVRVLMHCKFVGRVGRGNEGWETTREE